MEKFEYGYSDLDEALSFFEKEIKQHEIATGGVLGKEYRKYLDKKTKHYQVAIMAIKEFFQGE